MKKTLEGRLLERMKNSKQMILIITKDTEWDRGILNFKIEKAVDLYKIPLIIDMRFIELFRSQKNCQICGQKH